ncbi:MAG TPA: cupredoxin domain-containing protein [Xanthobacteraceae bacterium]|nr:cupredoxin domain-containing protein [Xanthobacteraceae bacterium]
MARNARATVSSILLASIFVMSLNIARAEDETVMLSLTIKDHLFEPAEVHAPPGKPIALTVKNLGTIASEFESSALHVEKVIPPGGTAIVHVRPLEPGRYNFFDDFHRATQGFLVVP